MTPMLRVLATLGLLAGLSLSSAAQSIPAPSLPDVAYGPYADPGNPDSCERLDVYLHLDAATPQPVLFEVHGGGFQGGTKSDFTPYPRR